MSGQCNWSWTSDEWKRCKGVNLGKTERSKLECDKNTRGSVIELSSPKGEETMAHKGVGGVRVLGSALRAPVTTAPM